MYAVSATGWYESNMVWTHLKWFFIVSSLTVVSGNVKCSEAVNGQSLTCQCVTDNSIDWIKDGTLISGCSSAFCIPSSLNGETFNPITNGYEIVITTFNDSYCGEYSCVDNVATTSYSFPTCKEPCECKCVFDGGKIAYIIIDCLLDVGFCVAAFVLTCKRFSGEKRQEGVIKNVLIGVCVAVVVILDCGLTIYYFAEDCGEDCSDECNSKCCTKGLRMGLTVVAWIPFDIAGYVMIVRYFISGGLFKS